MFRKLDLTEFLELCATPQEFITLVFIINSQADLVQLLLQCLQMENYTLLDSISPSAVSMVSLQFSTQMDKLKMNFR